MAREEALKCISVPANTDLSSYQYRFVTVNSSGNLALTGDGANADGVLQDKPAAAGRPGSMAIEGVTKLIASGTITAGDDIASGASGVGVKATTGDIINARALESVSDGELFSALLLAPNTGTLS